MHVLGAKVEMPNDFRSTIGLGNALLCVVGTPEAVLIQSTRVDALFQPRSTGDTAERTECLRWRERRRQSQ